jgi:hypothetical protein
MCACMRAQRIVKLTAINTSKPDIRYAMAIPEYRQFARLSGA